MYLDEKYFPNFRKVLPSGECTDLQRMFESKSHFAMALWKERSTLFALGGLNNRHTMKQV